MGTACGFSRVEVSTPRRGEIRQTVTRLETGDQVESLEHVTELFLLGA